MIRTCLSFCFLFGALLSVSWLLHDDVEQSPAARPAKVRPAAREVRQPAAPRPAVGEAACLEAEGCHEPELLVAANARALIPARSFTGDVRPTGFGDETFFDDVFLDLEAGVSPEESTAKNQPAQAAPADVEANADPVTPADKMGPADEPTTENPPADAKPASDQPARDQSADEPARLDQPAAAKVIPSQALTAEQERLRDKVRACLGHYYHRPENVVDRSPWGVMHAMIAYGVDTNVIANNRLVNATGWLCYNGVCKGQNLFYVQNRRLHARVGVGVQGHAGQFLAMLAQSRVMTDYPIKADGVDFTVQDLIEHEQLTCRDATELTFKLIAFAHYLPSDAKWKNNLGEDWDLPRVIREELKQPIIGAACGGTHRMMGFSYAVRKHEKRGGEFEGQWLRARKFVDAYHEYTFRLQNPDGSFSTDWFAGRGDNGPPSRRLETTGHILEWFSYSLPEDQLRDPRVMKSVDYLANLLWEGRNTRWNIGPLGHGLHALAIYDERVFGGQPGQRAMELARKPQAEQAK